MDQQLLRAAGDGILRPVKQALQKGANVNCQCRMGETPLHKACMSGHFDVVEYLLTSHRANLEATDNSGRTPLLYACLSGHIEVVRYLLSDRGANLEATDNAGNTPLHLACWDSHFEVIRYLLSRRAPLLEAKNTRGWTPLRFACEVRGVSGLEVARFLVEQGAGLCAVCGQGETVFDCVFLASVVRARLDALRNFVDFLLRTYAAKIAGHEDTLAIHSILQTATFLGDRVHLPLGRLVVVHFTRLLGLFPDSSFSRRDDDGALPLHVACEKGAPVEIVRPLLLRHAAALHMRNNSGDLPLHAACRAAAAAEPLIRFLAEQDPNAVEAPNNDEALPLHLLCGSSRPTLRAVKYLVDAFEGALGMVTNQGGDLPLMVACQASASESVLQVLLRADPAALIYMQEYYSRTPRAPGAP